MRERNGRGFAAEPSIGGFSAHSLGQGWLSSTSRDPIPVVADCGLSNLPSTTPTHAGVARHERMVSLVQHMLDLHKRVAAEQVPHAKTMLQRHAAGGGDGSARHRRTRWCMSCMG